MPHRIILTGVPITPLRKKPNNIFTFDMREEGSKKAPSKGLPYTDPIYYTVFCNLRQLNRSGVDRTKFMETTLLIDGEPTFQMPRKDCTGQIAVVCRTMSMLYQDEQQNGTVDENVEQVDSSIISPENVISPLMIPLSSIKIPAEFIAVHPRKEKIDQKVQFLSTYGKQEKPVLLRKADLILIDGYTTYLAAKKLGKTSLEVELKE